MRESPQDYQLNFREFSIPQFFIFYHRKKSIKLWLYHFTCNFPLNYANWLVAVAHLEKRERKKEENFFFFASLSARSGLFSGLPQIAVTKERASMTEKRKWEREREREFGDRCTRWKYYAIILMHFFCSSSFTRFPTTFFYAPVNCHCNVYTHTHNYCTICVILINSFLWPQKTSAIADWMGCCCCVKR